MSHRSRSSHSATSTASGSTSAGSGETAGSSGDGATDTAVVTPQAPGGSTEEVGTSAIRAAVLGILADPEVIRQFGTAVALASVPSTSGGSMEVRLLVQELLQGNLQPKRSQLLPSLAHMIRCFVKMSRSIQTRIGLLSTPCSIASPTSIRRWKQEHAQSAWVLIIHFRSVL